MQRYAKNGGSQRRHFFAIREKPVGVVKITPHQGEGFNKRPAAGGGRIRPLPDFLDSSKTAHISMQNFKYLSQHQFDVCHQNFAKIREKIYEKMAF